MVTESVNEILDSAATYACHTGLTEIDVSIVALATLQTNEVQAFLKLHRISGQAICEEICGIMDTLEKETVGGRNERFAMSQATMFVYKMGAGLARSLKQDFSPLYLLAGLTDGQPGDGHYHISQIMEKHGLNGENLYEHISYANFLGGKISQPLDKPDPKINAEVKEKLAQIQAEEVLDNCPVLKECCENLMQKARDARIDPVIGREQEIGRTIRILSRRKKNNPILLGEPGVGKTAVAEELARRIVAGLVPENLKNKVILSLDLGALVGGTKFRGDLEERLKKVLIEVKKLGNVILFIDEIHLLTSRLMDGCSDLFKPALANGELTAIGATTHSEYLQHFEKDAAMARRFQPVMVNEPDRSTAVVIIQGLLPHYESHHGVRYAHDVAEHAVDMAIRYIPRQSLPDKAIDLVDEAGAIAMADGQTIVTKETVDRVIHDMAGAGATPTNPEKAVLSLRNNIIGQTSALETIERFLRSVELRLVNGEVKGTLMVSAEEGTGKSHFVKCLAQATGSRLFELDGQQYQHENAIWRLLGSMPGYRDHEKGGQLSEAIRRNPRTLLAIKNFDQAHSEVQEMLISMISNGVVTDSANKPVSASDTYVVLLKDKKASKNMGFLSPNSSLGETSMRADLEELIDCHVALGQPDISELAELLNTMTENLQVKLRNVDRDFAISAELKEFILKAATTADKKFERLKQEFLVRVKSKLLSHPMAPGSSVVLQLDRTQ
jgi:ATP-dependent Clp protease ATP-binding subunit ClpA